MSDSEDFVFSVSDDVDSINRQLEKELREYHDRDAIIEVHEEKTNYSNVIIIVPFDRLLNAITAAAWKMIPNAPIQVELILNTGMYRGDKNVPRTAVFQEAENDRVRLTQLNNIVRRRVREIWMMECDDGNVFEMIYATIIERLPTLNKHCISCDEVPKLIENVDMNSMLCPFVCGGDICLFQYNEFGIGREYSTSIYSSTKIIHLLVLMTDAAFRSKRRDIIFAPYPTIFDGTAVVLSNENRNNELLGALMDKLPLDESFYCKIDVEKELLAIGSPVLELQKWILNSNRSCIAPIPKYLCIDEFANCEQYLLISDSPEKECIFQERRARYGSIYAYHGSPFENWHSILRNGLYNASGTKFQTTGAVHGPGIYMSPSFLTAASYSRIELDTYGCIALCEVINDGINKPTSAIWTIGNPMNICTRFLLVYPSTARIVGGNEVISSDELLCAKLDSLKQFFK